MHGLHQAFSPSFIFRFLQKHATGFSSLQREQVFVSIINPLTQAPDKIPVNKQAGHEHGRPGPQEGSENQ